MKCTTPTDDILAIDRIKEIHARIPNTHLVMHGSSSVPQEWLEVINQYGGEIPETYGVPVEQIVEGIKYGVRKVNIDTDLRLASTGAIRRHLAMNPSNFDPRKFLAAATQAMTDICIARYEAFGTAFFGFFDRIAVRNTKHGNRHSVSFFFFVLFFTGAVKTHLSDLGCYSILSRSNQTDKMRWKIFSDRLR